ncbi:MAG: polysaccharide biosynthesis C-terminal domain-containing protein [Sedimentisphaerales bacterium]|nr:polysaccharide biosynthesis C-terminal domain-containing protein [Sedimentisphaerales bacterium]
MSLIRKGIFTGGSAIACAGLQVLASMMLARDLLPAGMGKFQLPQATCVLIVTFLCLGIGQANIYVINKLKTDPKQVVKNSLCVSFLGFVLLAVSLPLVLSVFEGYFGAFPLWTKVVFSIGIACSYGMALLRPILLAALQVRQVVAVDVVNKGAALLLVAIGYFAGWLTVNTALLIVAISFAVGLLVTLWFLRDRIDLRYRFSFSVLRAEFLYGLRLLLANVVNVVDVSIGLILLRYLIPDDFDGLGHYGRAISVCNLSLLIPLAVGPLLYAKWSSVSEEQRKSQVAMATRIYLLMALAIMVGLVFFARWAILILCGRAFLPAVPILQIMAVGIFLRCSFSMCNSLLASDGKAEVTAYVRGVSVIVIAAVTFLMVPRYGVAGAAWANTAGGLVVGLAYLAIFKMKYGFSIWSLVIVEKRDFVYMIDAVFGRSGLSKAAGPAGDNEGNAQ